MLKVRLYHKAIAHTLSKLVKNKYNRCRNCNYSNVSIINFEAKFTHLYEFDPFYEFEHDFTN